MSAMSDSAVHGSRVAIVMFDKPPNILQRIIPNLSEKRFLQPGTAEFSDIAARFATESKSAAQLVDILVPNFLFPRWGGDTEPRSSFLNRALFMFERETDFQYTSSSVMLFSDMLFNCKSPWHCDNSPGEHFSSLYNAIEFIGDDPMISGENKGYYVERHIAAHFFPFGDKMFQHNVLLHSETNPAECLTDRDARLAGGDALSKFVKWGAAGNCLTLDFDNDGRACEHEDNFVAQDRNISENGNQIYHYLPNRLYYYAAIPTQGGWYPLRECCDPQCDDVSAELNSACNSDTTGDPVVVNGYTDQYGRLGCDAQGRSMSRQIQEAAQDILSEHPIVLVEGKLKKQEQ